MHERARIAGELHSAGREEIEGLDIPQLEGDDRAGSVADKRQRTTDILVGDIRCEQELKPAGERRGRCRVPVGQAGREGVEQNISRAGRGGAGLRRPRGLGERARAARDLEVSDHCASERLEVCLARQLGVERLEAPRCAGQQAPGVVAPLLLQRDSAPQELGVRAPELVQRPGFGLCQARERSVECARSRFAEAAASMRCPRRPGSLVSSADRS